VSIKYLDFDLLIERSLDRYRARVLESPAGEASIEFSVPFSQTEIDDFFTQIGQTRSFETQQIRKIHGFGQALFEAVFAGQVRDRLRASLGEANLQSAGLRIRLRLADTPELGNLPWEFIYDPGLNRFLALSIETPLVRYLETPQLSQPFAVQPPLRILAMICGPKDFPRLDVEREWKPAGLLLQSLQTATCPSLEIVPAYPICLQRLRHSIIFLSHCAAYFAPTRRFPAGNEQRRSPPERARWDHPSRPSPAAVGGPERLEVLLRDDQPCRYRAEPVQQDPAVIATVPSQTIRHHAAHEFYGTGGWLPCGRCPDRGAQGNQDRRERP
jgi:hypothetical protein